MWAVRWPGGRSEFSCASPVCRASRWRRGRRRSAERGTREPRTSHRLEGRQHLAAVEQPNVLGLDRRQAAHRPGEMHEVRLERRPQRMHPGFLRQQIALPSVTATARRQHVGPAVGASARQRYQVVSCQALSVPQLLLAAPAELAAVVVTSEEESVGDLTAEATRHMDELDRSEEHTSELQSLAYLVCRLLLEK